MLTIDMDLKAKLFGEYLDNGGIEKIVFPELLEDLIKVKKLPNGKVNPDTISPLVNAAMLAYIADQITGPFTSSRALSEYKTILQKSIFFDQETVESEEEFDSIFEKYLKAEKILFRGLNEAKYRLYSSLQRKWIHGDFSEKKVNFEVFLENLVDYARKIHGGVLTRYFEFSRFDPNNDLGILSFLQHYGCGTPLLDWTYSFANSLYFASELVKEPTTGWEIDRYFCVYFVDEKDLEKGSVKNVVHEGLAIYRERFKKELLDNMLSGPFTQEQIDHYFKDDLIDEMFLATAGRGAMTHMTKIHNLVDARLLYFSDFNKEDKLRYYLNNSMNIVNQKGAFTWNADPVMPLEHVANEIVKEENPDAEYHFCQCININKSLAFYVKKKLKSVGITKEFIYPDPAEIAQTSFKNVLKQMKIK